MDGACLARGLHQAVDLARLHRGQRPGAPALQLFLKDVRFRARLKQRRVLLTRVTQALVGHARDHGQHADRLPVRLTTLGHARDATARGVGRPNATTHPPVKRVLRVGTLASRVEATHPSDISDRTVGVGWLCRGLLTDKVRRLVSAAW